MKQHTARIALFTTFLGLSAQAAPFMAVGDNAELFVTAAAQVQFDDNIYLDPTNEADDTVLSFTPGVDLVFGKGSVTKGNAYYREEIRRYTDNDNQDTELSSLGVNSYYDNGVTKAGFNASYAQLAQNDNDVNILGGIVRRKVTAIGANIEIGVSEKTALATGASFDSTDYGSAGFSDSDVWTLPLDVYYKATPKLDWSLGYRYRNSELSGSGDDSTDHFWNVGIRGEISPKLNGHVKVGFTQRSIDGAGDENLLGLNGNLSYAFSEKTSYQFNISNDFGSSGTGDTTETFSIGLNASNKLSEQWAFNGGLNFRKVDYPTRTDDFIEGSVGINYKLNAAVNFGASYTYRDNSSDARDATTGLRIADYTNSVFSLSANIRY